MASRGRRGRRPVREPSEAEERRQASREIGQAYRMVQSLRPLFLAAAALVTVLLLLILATAPDSADVGILLGGLGATAVLLAVGAWRAFREPLLWSVVAAGFVSLFIALLLLVGSRGPFTWWGVAIMIALWLVVPMAQRAGQLMREHPDLYITERWKGRRAAADESESGRRLRERMAAERTSARRRILVGTVLVIAAAAAFAFLGKQTRESGSADEWVPPAPFAPYAGKFLERWNRSDKAALGELVHARDLGYMKKVERRLVKRGWQEKLPTLMPPRFDQRDDDRKLKVYFPLKDYEGTVELGTVWWWAGGEWWWYGSIWPKSEDLGR